MANLITFLLLLSSTVEDDEVNFYVQNTPDLVEGGIPLKKEWLSDIQNAGLFSKGGEAVEGVYFKPLGYWEDGSIKWLYILFYGETGAGSNFYISNDDGEELTRNGINIDNPFDFEVELEAPYKSEPVSQKNFPMSGNAVVREGGWSSHYNNPGLELTVRYSFFPGLNCARYFLTIKQLENGRYIKGLKVKTKNTTMVSDERNLGVEVTGNGNNTLILIDGKEPLDAGIGRTWEIWQFKGKTRPDVKVGRPQVDPGYLNSAGVMGSLPEEIPGWYQDDFNESIKRVLRKKSSNEKNFGWRNHGSFYDRGNPSYYGYYNQEYDPATALLLEYMRDGNPDLLSSAEELAMFYRDMCISNEGGSYQHRATLHSALAHVISVISRHLKGRIMSHDLYQGSRQSVVDAISDMFGSNAAKAIGRGLKGYTTGSFDESLDMAVTMAVSSLIENVIYKMKSGYKDGPEGGQKFNMRPIIKKLLGHKSVKQLGEFDVDEVFSPFFERYGGSWNEFPAFHVDMHPDPSIRHQGSHSLVEMLVYMYFLTGDELYRDVAIKSARYHVDALVPQELEKNLYQLKKGKSLTIRGLGWPLINLMSLWELTEYVDPGLNEEIKSSALKIVRRLGQNDITSVEGSIHSGVCLEGLSRYHEKTGDTSAGQLIVEWAKYWAKEQWNNKGQAFNYKRDKSNISYTGMSTLNLYGFAYAYRLRGEGWLKRRILEAVDGMKGSRASNPKVFAMHYRSMSRALGIISSW